MKNIKKVSVFLFIVLIAGCGTGEQGSDSQSDVLPISIWHTELDPDASQIIGEVADSVESYFRRQGEFSPVITVSALRWGDVATRIFQEQDNLPDVVHLQPFMAKEFYLRLRNFSDGFELYSLDDLISRIEQQNEDSVLASLRNIHRYRIGADDRTATFGIAYAVGITFIAYRADWNHENLPIPSSWNELIDFADALAENASSSDRAVAPFILPGRSPFFIDQLTNEILVSIGGSLYNEGRPNLNSEKMREVIWLMQEMIARTNNEYWDTNYQQQFTLFANGEGAVVPVTYGRATKQIDEVLMESNSAQEELSSLRNAYAVMKQPGALLGNTGVATIDAEPWVVIARTSNDIDAQRRIAVAEKFLEYFYAEDTYFRFSGTVPVHLRPIFVNMAQDYDSLESQINWKHWIKQNREMLMEEGKTAPILMDATDSTQPQPTFALSLQLRAIISDMISDSVPEDLREDMERRIKSGEQPGSTERERRESVIETAIERAQQRAEALYAEAPQG